MREREGLCVCVGEKEGERGRKTRDEGGGVVLEGELVVRVLFGYPVVQRHLLCGFGFRV